MQATTSKKRFDPGQFRTAALFIGIAGIVAVGAATIARLQDDSPRALPAAATSSIQMHPDEAYRLEQEMLMDELHAPGHSIESPAPASRSTGDDFPDRKQSIVGGYSLESVEAVRLLTPAEMRFIEDNVNLPGDTTRSATPDYRLLDQNVLPGDDIQLVAPHADPVMPLY